MGEVATVPKWKSVLLLSAVLAALPGVAAPAQQSASEASAISPARSEADCLAADLVAKLTLDEKVEQLLNVAPAIPRLKIPRYNWWTESLHGALGPVDTTNYPEPIGLAATFDPALVHDVAGAIGTEVRALHTMARQTGRYGRIGTGLDTWSPNINIFRDPRWGRGQETYGEDPFLTARMGVAFVQGMQGPDSDRPYVIATPKHYAVHSGPESTRHEANVYVSMHDLEDTYLPAFRAAVTEARAGSIMCAYNRIDGQPACANDLLLKEHLRGAWGFQGYVVSDCDAVKDIADNHKYAPDAAAAVAAAMRAGVDNECNGATLNDTTGLADRYREALARNLITVGDVDRALVRLFSARFRNGDLPGLAGAPPAVPVTAIGSREHQALALTAAEKSLVLLKNDGVLPLKPSLRVAVVGPFGDATRVPRGNYSSGLTGPRVSVIDGLRRAMPGAQITLVPFGESLTDGDRVPTSSLRTPDGRPGIQARYYNPVRTPPTSFAPGTREAAVAAVSYQTKPVVTRVEPDIGERQLELAKVADIHRVVFAGFLVPAESGIYRVGLSGAGSVARVNGQVVADRRNARWNDLPTFTTMELQAGRRYPITVEGTGGDLVWKRISADPAAALKQAAANADVVVATVGLTSDLEAEETGVKVPGFEGGDKTTLDLPQDQRTMLTQAKATGKPLIVVAMNGSPINLAWAKDNSNAILEAWYPGQAGGAAIGNVLSGLANPAGRLPLTFYRSTADLPPFGNYEMKGRTYRYFEGTPVFPFGHGLSYTRFNYAPLTVRPVNGGAENGVRITTELRNVGDRPGEEVAQLYLNFPDTPGASRIALRGLQRVKLAPGERQTLTFALSPRDLSSVALDGTRIVAPGTYRVSVGSGQPGTGVPGRSERFTTRTGVVLPR